MGTTLPFENSAFLGQAPGIRLPVAGRCGGTEQNSEEQRCTYGGAIVHAAIVSAIGTPAEGGGLFAEPKCWVSGL